MKTKIICLSICLLSISGCGGSWSKDSLFNFGNSEKRLNDASTVINKKAVMIQKASKDIKEKAGEIDTSANEIGNTLPNKAQAQVGPYIVRIKKNSDLIIQNTVKIDDATLELKSTSVELYNIKSKVTELETKLKKTTKERNEAIEAKNSQFSKMLRWLIMACIIGAGLCIVAFVMYGSKKGITGAGACGIILAVALAVQSYIVYLAIGGMVLLCALVIYIGYQAYLRQKAFKEVVDTVEVTKSNLDPQKKKELFGKDGQTGIMDSIQSPSTMNLVRAEKDKQPSLWSLAKNKIS